MCVCCFCCCCVFFHLFIFICARLFSAEAWKGVELCPRNCYEDQIHHLLRYVAFQNDFMFTFHYVCVCVFGYVVFLLIWKTKMKKIIDTRHNEIDERLLLNEWNPNEAAVRFGLDSVEWVHVTFSNGFLYTFVCACVCVCMLCRLSIFFFYFVVVQLFLIVANFVITILCVFRFIVAGLQYFLTPISSACDEVAKIKIVLEWKHNEINSA